MQEINAGLIVGLAGALSGAIMAALALAVSRAPGWTELRSFAYVAISASAYCVFGLAHVLPVAEHVVVIGDMLTLAASYAYGMLWIRYLAVVAKRPLKRWERAAIAIGIVLVILALVPGVMIVRPIQHVHVEWFGVTYRMANGTLLAIAGVAFTVVTTIAAALGTGQRWNDGWHARLPVVGAIALAVTGVTDTIGSIGMAPIPQLIEPVTVVVIGAIGASYAQRFVADARRLEALSENLERVVAERTSELLEAQMVAVTSEKLAGLGRMAAGVAHEINNPTAVIQYNVELLRMMLDESGLLTPEVAERLEHSRDATRRIADIVRLLLDTSRDRASSPASTTVFELLPIVDRVVGVASITAPELRVEVRLAAGLCARGEPSSLEQALINLVTNSAHATRGGAGAARVRIEGERAGERVLLRVIDNGPGIPDSIRGRLFEPFSTTKPIGEGTGLGLAVSRGLMTRQGGALEVARTSSDGTEMALELPAADASELPVTNAVASTHALPPSANPASSIHVLVIEDNEDQRDVLTLQLDRFFHITSAATVDQALEIVRARSYDVVLCDVMMPSGGAEAWLSRCAEIDPKLEERTILLTGGPTTVVAASLVRDRADKVLFKPVDLNVLRPMIVRMAQGVLPT